MARRKQGEKTKAQLIAQKIKKSTPAMVSKESHRGVKLFCQAVVERILIRVSEGETLRRVCLDPDMPTWVTVHAWMRENPDFAANVERARSLGKEYNLDYVIDLADEVEIAADVQPAKIKIDTRFRTIEMEDRRVANEAKRVVDPKLVEAAPDTSGEWRVLENGETANPLKDALDMFRRKRGLTVNGS